MRKIIVSNMVTLDGFIGGPNGEIDWHVVNDEFFEQANHLLDSVDTFLFGRVTYEGMLQYWTSPAGMADDPVIANKMNTTPKIVFSRTLDKVGWGQWDNARLIKDNIPEELSKLKQQPGRDMVIFGSGKIVALLTQLRLIDEYRIFVAPVVIGGGISQFAGVTASLRLLEARTYNTGVVLLRYTLDQG
jgi:dihydrofolate reductase